jgi:Domain of unknown function (DUF4160)
VRTLVRSRRSPPMRLRSCAVPCTRRRRGQEAGVRCGGDALVVPTISRFYWIVIRMYFSDHAPPHFHALYGGEEAVVAIGRARSFVAGCRIERCGWCENGRRSIATNSLPTGSASRFPISRSPSHHCHERIAHHDYRGRAAGGTVAAADVRRRRGARGRSRRPCCRPAGCSRRSATTRRCSARSLLTVSSARSCGPVMSISIPTFYAGIGILPQVGTYLDESFSRPEQPAAQIARCPFARWLSRKGPLAWIGGLEWCEPA